MKVINRKFSKLQHIILISAVFLSFTENAYSQTACKNLNWSKDCAQEPITYLPGAAPAGVLWIDGKDCSTAGAYPANNTTIFSRPECKFNFKPDLKPLKPAPQCSGKTPVNCNGLVCCNDKRACCTDPKLCDMGTCQVWAP